MKYAASGTRVPKADQTEKIAEALNVSPAALNVPDIESYVGVMHTLFALEDLYGIKIDEVDGEPVIRLNKNSRDFLEMCQRLQAWQKEDEKWRNGEIIKEEYDQWRYRYPLVEAERTHKRLSEKRKADK